jgi:glycosyltransferase involved in cell wall biosynthesis
VTLGIVYHMPFWRASDGTLREVEGSFARYVDSLAPYFDEISLCVPILPVPRGAGTAIRSPNVTLMPLAAFDGPVQFYPRLLPMLPRLWQWMRRIDVLHCRVPSPAAVFAFAAARLIGRPVFLLVVGDLRALLPSTPYRGWKRACWRAYTAFEERNVQWMVDASLAFANGRALCAKHARSDGAVLEMTTTTISDRDIVNRIDTCMEAPIRILSVSRIEPRKGLRVLPQVIRLLVDRQIDVRLDIVGPVVGRLGVEERRTILQEAVQLGVEDRVALLGPLPLNELLAMYSRYAAFVLPTLPGEGIPRVLLEAMSAGLPLVTTRVAGIPDLVVHERNGLLVDDPGAASVAAALAQIVTDGALRRHLIAHGYETARRFTLDAQAARMMEILSGKLQLALKRPAVAPLA